MDGDNEVKTERGIKMWRFKAILIGVLGVLIFGALAQVSAAAVGTNARVIHVSGEISWIDVKVGKLQLAADASRDRRDPTEYRVNKDATRVTDPTDKKFIKLEDLRVGQHVAIEFDYIDGEWKEAPIAQKIIASSIPGPVFQVVTGVLAAIDAQAGTFSIEQRPLPSEGRGNMFYFAFEPSNIIAMRAPSRQPVQLEFNPGDLVQVEFVVIDGKNYARSITLLSVTPGAPVATGTTTTTTTSTIVTH